MGAGLDALLLLHLPLLAPLLLLLTLAAVAATARRLRALD